MKKLLFSVFLIFLCSGANDLSAQDYNTAVGARLGWGLGVSYKTFIKESNAIEVNARLSGYNSFSLIYVSGLYQIHAPIESVDGLAWYFGGGVGAVLGNNVSGINLLGNLGLDYTFSDAPINISLDWIPTFNLRSGSSFNGESGGLAIRYILR